MNDRIAPSVKCCRTCKEIKPISEFWRKHVTADGFANYCKDCVRSRRGSDPEKCARRTATRIRRTSEQGKPFRTCGSCMELRPVKMFGPVTVRDGVDSICRLCRQVTGLKVRARGVGAPSIPYSTRDLAERARMFGDACWMCGTQWSSWDHVKPLARGGTDCVANLRPSCTRCNSRKKDHWNGVAWTSDLQFTGGLSKAVRIC
jgi:hypothetical protein